MLKSFKYRLYPSKAQAEIIDQTIGVCRLVYNLALEVKITAYRSAGIHLSTYDLQRQLKDLRAEYPWIKDVSRVSLDATIAQLDTAFKGFYAGGGYPKFNKKRYDGSFGVPSDIRRIDWGKSTLTINKLKDVPIVLSRQFDGEIRKVTISRLAIGQYFASILVQTPEVEPIPPVPKQALGVDLGISSFAALSTGRKIDNPKYLQSEINRLKVLQRRASKKKKGGKNRRKALLRVAKLHNRIANKRADFLHKLSSELVRDSQTDTICLESLAVKNMVQNRTLSKAISDASWAEFVRQLEYKARWYGKNIIRVNRFYASSKTCSTCGHQLDSLPLSVRQWACECGAIHDRDINAAINIRNSGLGKPSEPTECPAMKGHVEVGKLVDY
jgi:putative transposase